MATPSWGSISADEHPQRRPSLGKRLISWHKRNPKTNSERSFTELEMVEVLGAEEFFVGDRIIEAGTFNAENWAVVWLGKLLHRRKWRKNLYWTPPDEHPLESTNVKLVTLTEQLTDAQAMSLHSASESKVCLSLQMIYYLTGNCGNITEPVSRKEFFPKAITNSPSHKR